VAKKTAGSGPPVLTDETPAQPAMEYPKRTADKVCVTGFAEGHRHLAPLGDPTWEVWGLNRLHTVQPGPYTRWFEIHDVRQFYEQDPQHREWMRTYPGPIYLRPQDVGVYDIPTGVPYPAARVLAEFGRYFTNSISWMIALGIGMGFKEMLLVGVDMAQDQVFPTNEYRQQRPSCEYLLGVAVGRGMKIHLPPGSDLLKTSFLYGMEDGDAILGKRMSRIEELNKRKNVIREQIAQLEGQKVLTEKQYYDQKIALVSSINQLDGALQEAVYEQVNLSPSPEVMPERTKPA